jgi:Thermolysin metallopeptidase, alpha-helical domain/Calx-beta domain/PA domain
VDRGTCNFTMKVKNAQLNGAIGVIVANHSAGGNVVITMSGVDPTITIPSVSVGFSHGNLIKSEIAGGVNATLRLNAPDSTDNSYRWLISEDSTGFGGAIRDMWQPTCYNHPGKVSDTQYVCATGDNGGVHSNSGVPNHGFALLVDGGNYNGQSIGALGPVKASHLYYRAMTIYQNPASDFADHADALEQSCSDLLGASLTGFDGGESGEALTAADCSQVSEMIAAVELRMPPTQCNFQPLLAKNAPERCEVGTTQVDIFQDTFELPPSGWTVSHTAVSPSFTPRDWEWVSTLPDRDGSAFFGADPNIGSCIATDDESGVLHLDSPVVSVPAGAAAPRMTFDHWVSTEAGFDGGNLQISVSGGPWQPVQPADFTFNTYNTTLATVAQGNTNPLAGQAAFSGSDGGSVSGSWGRSHVNLAPYVSPGQSFQLRWNLGTDGCTGLFGWYVDDVTVYSCSSGGSVPSVSINDVAVAEGNQRRTDAVFTVSLSNATNEPVKVKYKVMPGTAQQGSDYLTVGTTRGSGEIVISPLSTSAEITVRIVGDLHSEPDETYFVILEKAENATIGDGTGQGTILNDDGP